MRTTALSKAVTAITLVIVAGVASAADTDEQKALVRAQRLLHQMSQERDAAQAENAKLKIEVEELNKKLGGLKKSSETSLAKAHENNVALNESLQKTTQNLHQTETEKTQLQATVVDQAQLIESCAAKNVKMVQINRELLDHYAQKGCFDAMLQREPLTQLKRVELENIVQEYQDQIDQQEFKQKTATAAAH
jgi:hypothetical protein